MASKTVLFVFLITFWTVLTILGNIFDYSLSQTHITELTHVDDSIEEDNPSIIENITNYLDTLPIIKYVTPLIKMTTFQYSDEIPPLLSIFLSMFSIFSIYILILIIRGDS